MESKILIVVLIWLLNADVLEANTASTSSIKPKSHNKSSSATASGASSATIIPTESPNKSSSTGITQTISGASQTIAVNTVSMTSSRSMIRATSPASSLALNNTGTFTFNSSPSTTEMSNVSMTSSTSMIRATSPASSLALNNTGTFTFNSSPSTIEMSNVSMTSSRSMIRATSPASSLALNNTGTFTFNSSPSTIETSNVPTMSSNALEETRTPAPSFSLTSITTSVISSSMTIPTEMPGLNSSSSPLAVSATPSSSISVNRETEKPLTVEVSLRFKDKRFKKSLEDEESLEYLTMRDEVVELINNAYENNAEFLSTRVVRFRNGSIICDTRTYFNRSTSNVTQLRRVLSDYGVKNGFSVTGFQITNKTLGEDKDDDGDDQGDKDDDEDILFGFDWWQIGVGIGGIVSFVLLITVIVLCCKVEDVNEKRKTESSSYKNQYYGLENGSEMKMMRASRAKLPASPDQSARGSTGAETGSTADVYHSATSNGSRGDGPARQAKTRTGTENQGRDNEEDEDGYVVPLNSNVAHEAPPEVLSL